MAKTKTINKQRLESLDALRGFDLFVIVGLELVLHPMARAVDKPWFDKLMWNFTHVDWVGFSPWDLVMPLFLFMAGVSLPFALSRYKTGGADKKIAYRRIAKRVVLLWVFGMMCQGNLLGLAPSRIYLYSNTLQSIAIGYLIAAVLYLNFSIKAQIGIAAGLLLGFWAAMQFITVDGYGGGDYTPAGNLAEWVDRQVLGRFRDNAKVVDGEVIFSPYYNYTWVLSSLNFGVTVLTGLFAGHILKSETFSAKRKWQLLVVIGLAMTAAGWLWHLQMPVIKKLWTSSMVLVSSGYSFVLMGLFYYRIDYKGKRKGITWLKVYGMNSIAAYMIVSIVSFRSVATSLFYGLEQYIGNWYPVLLMVANSLIIYLILWMMYKNKVFLKV